MNRMKRLRSSLLAWCVGAILASPSLAQSSDRTLRVFIFAGQSNMVGSDSKVAHIERFPPFVGLGEPQERVLFHYSIGRNRQFESEGFARLAPVNDTVGPELSFARKVTANVDAPIAIIKVAVGGTHLGGDWNPDEPSDLALYPRALGRVQEALADLDRQRIRYRLEGFMWHQGENDMFDEGHKANYGRNLANYLERWRSDLDAPELRFYVGELCTKTIWGLDLRASMHAISLGQRAVTDADPLAQYVPTSHIGVDIASDVGLHYHYGTLGQLEHGENYADAYLRTIGELPETERELRRWPYRKDDKIRLFVLCGHRNMEGEQSFTQDLARLRGGKKLLKDDEDIAYRYSLGGGVITSDGWEPLGAVGPYDTFGPELTFAARLERESYGDFAIAKFTHSGSQLVDWTPGGSEAASRNLYESFVAFVRASITDLEDRGHEVELAGIVHHLSENDMSWMPSRRRAAERLKSLVARSRVDLAQPDLHWFVSQQEPTDQEDLNRFDALAAVRSVADGDPLLHHVEAFGLLGEEHPLVMRASGIAALGRLQADAVLAVIR